MTDSEIASFMWIGVIIIGAIGWIMNIIQIAQADALSGLVILRAIGIFMFPLGAVLGFV
jgi:hypothetical protein